MKLLTLSALAFALALSGCNKADEGGAPAPVKRANLKPAATTATTATTTTTTTATTGATGTTASTATTATTSTTASSAAPAKQ